MSLFLTKNGNRPFSEPSLNWAKSHDQEQGALIISKDTREHRETVENILKCFELMAFFVLSIGGLKMLPDYLQPVDFRRWNKVQTKYSTGSTVQFQLSDVTR